MLLAVSGILTLQARAGVILISTRSPQDTRFNATEYVTDEKGPGMGTR